MEQHSGLDECPRILLLCFRARNSGKQRSSSSLARSAAILLPREIRIRLGLACKVSQSVEIEKREENASESERKCN